MKLSTPRSHFLAALQSVVRVSSTRSAIQALAGVRIAAQGSTVELEATDGDLALHLTMPATVEQDGAVLLPARLLADVVRALPDGDLLLTARATEQDVEVAAGAAHFHIRTLRAEDFPELPAPPSETVTLPANALVQTTANVARAASRDETRPVLTGILMSASDHELRMVATDSYRLSVKETKLEQPVATGFEANVPARALQELVRIAGQGPESTVHVGVSESRIVFRADGAILSSRLIDGQFPNYRQLLPDSHEHELRLATAELLDVVRRVSLLAQRNAPLQLAFTEGELTISARTPDIGEASESLPVPFQGEPLEIGFNPDFLADGLESAGSDEVVLKLINPIRPGLIEAGDGSGFTYLIMPIRLNV